MTAQLNLAGVYGAFTGQGVNDATRAAAMYTQIAEDAAEHSLEHVATPMTNLGTLCIGQGRWDEASDAYARARHARAELTAQTAVRRLDDAVLALEDSRASILRCPDADRRYGPAHRSLTEIVRPCRIGRPDRTGFKTDEDTSTLSVRESH